ncbi:MAG: hypothetical protein AVDCRST_MAG93-5317, partial [uncultured Chloroflexia bacterium]
WFLMRSAAILRRRHITTRPMLTRCIKVTTRPPSGPNAPPVSQS